YTKESLPQPKDPRVKIVVVQEKYMAAKIYSGLWSEQKNNRLGQELKDWIEQKQVWSVNGTVQFAGYNPPWTLPYFRRNEVLLDISPK
ncbi:MAG: SOUL family heme-binding protein, partial [Bdellovibrionales bacterium]